MLELDPTEVHAFISYAHADSTIADAVHAQLIRLAERGRGKSALHCFLDTKDIDPGKRWEPVIIEELEAADWLIVLFTGDQSAYCGFEIGWYSRVNGLLGPEPIHDKRLLFLHDVDAEDLPAVLTPYQGKKILLDKDHLNLQSVTEGQQNDFWNSSPIAQFLRDFCKYKHLYEPDPEKPEGF
jgi:hypothetical protein